MKLAILGGGGFRVPLVYGALLPESARPRIEEVVLHDLAPDRLAAIAAVLEQQARAASDPPSVRTTTNLDDALAGSDFVFSAIRVGGLAGRLADERIALDLGLLGQETTGPGGVAYGLRTIPVAVHIAERVATVAPAAWVINFTNPAGMVTEAMQRVLGTRVIGICDSPVALGGRTARALGLDPVRTSLDYVGLNHLGWLRGLRCGGRDLLPDLLADDHALATVEEARLVGADWVRALGALPNEYLYYYYYTRDAVASIRGSPATRAEFLLRQQDGFYAAVARRRHDALDEWERVRQERDATYMAESREATGAGSRDVLDLAAGGYEGVALAVMASIARDEVSTMILDVRNGSAVPGLPPEAVVEVPCTVDADGAHPLATQPLTGHMLGLVQQVKAVEQLTIDAALHRSSSMAVTALALHPLVDSVTTAQVLFEAYQARIPALGELFGGRRYEEPPGRPHRLRPAGPH